MKKKIVPTLISLFFFVVSLDIIAQNHFIIRGKLLDRASQQTIANAYLCLPNKGIGTATNEEGNFEFIVPRIDADSSVVISVMGFRNFRKNIADFDSIAIIQLDSALKIPFAKQGNAKKIVQEVFQKIIDNYPKSPTYQIGFYSETIEMGDSIGFSKINEAVLRIERPNEKTLPDKIKLIKGRQYNKASETAKLNGFGFLNGAYVVTRTLSVEGPDYFAKNNLNQYHFELDSLLTFFDDKPVFIIHFSPKQKHLKAARNGIIYVDTLSKAIIRIEYQMTPEGVKDIIKGRMFSNLQKKGRAIRAYTDFRLMNGKWQLQDANIRFELEIEDTKPLNNKILAKMDWHFFATESLKMNRQTIKEEENLLSTEKFPQGGVYDNRFWGNYNHLLATDKMKEIAPKTKIRQPIK